MKQIEISDVLFLDEKVQDLTKSMESCSYVDICGTDNDFTQNFTYCEVE